MRRRYRSTLILAAVIGSLPSCGGGDDDDSPRELCETFATAACEKYVDCAVDAGIVPAAERDAVVDNCVEEAECADANEVPDGFDREQCLSDIEDASCDVALDPETELPASCGSEGSTPDATPQTRCELLLATVCTRIADCAVDDGTVPAAERDGYFDSCLTEVGQTVPCEQAVGIGADYDTCLEDINAATCTVIAESESLPDSCSEVILVDGQGGPAPP